MRRIFHMTGLIAGIVTAGLITTVAYAQAFGEGVLNAVSYRPLPAESQIRVQTLDNSDTNMALVAEVEQALKERGHQISDDARMILTVESRDEIGAWTTTDRRHTVEITGETGSHSDDALVKLNLFNSSTGGILNEGTNGTTIVTPSQYGVELTLDNADDGKRHWQAWAAADLGQSDSLDLMRGMVPALVDAIGKTISRETFPLQ